MWKFSALNLSIALLVLLGIGLVGYPSIAGWISQYNQSNVLFDQTKATSAEAVADIEKQLKAAADYNDALQSGALLESGANVAAGTGVSTTANDYWKLLNAEPSRMMSRLRIPAIEVDLPVYHGTSDATLLKGIGHLEGTSLPVGGSGTRSVLTGHRGLANATMFTNLNRVKKGDTFSVEVLGKVLTYKVFKIQIVEPDSSEQIRAVPGKDLMTLVTCTPLGINTQRILITGERVTPTPVEDIDAMAARPDVPGFPWWAVIGGGSVLLAGLWFWRAGYRPLGPVRPVATAKDEDEEAAAAADQVAPAAPALASASAAAPAASTGSGVPDQLRDLWQ